jgi:DNA-binding CsgD family transcriptional regulator
MKSSTLQSNLRVLFDQSTDQKHLFNLSNEPTGENQIGKALVEEFIGGILVFTDQQKLIYASESAYRALGQLKHAEDSKDPIPTEIWHICQSLVQSRYRFPDQTWLIEFDIFTNAATALHICSRWLKVDMLEHPCLLLTIEDRQQAVLNLVIVEADRYGLSPREKEVWLLQQSNYTYKQIAAELGITPNTVKKHMRNIYAKKRIQQDGAFVDS